MTINVSEAVFQRCSVEKMFLEISQNSQKNTCARVSFLIKLQALGEISKNTFFYKTPPLAAPHVSYTALWFLQLWKLRQPKQQLRTATVCGVGLHSYFLSF